jgi:hypothetical protein
MHYDASNKLQQVFDSYATKEDFNNWLYKLGNLEGQLYKLQKEVDKLRRNQDNHATLHPEG